MAMMSVKASSEEVQSIEKEILKKYQAQAALPGFRKGKIPLEILKKEYGTEILKHLEEELIRESITEAMKENDLKILHFQPTKVQISDSKRNFEAEGIFILSPEIKLPKYKGVKITYTEKECSEADAKKEFNLLREQYAETLKIEDRSLRNQDLALISYSSTYKGKPLQEAFKDTVGIDHLAKKEDFWLKIDKDSFLPNFCPQLEGMNIEEEKEFSLKLSKEFSIEDLKEKEVIFKVKLREIKELQLPEINDEFANKVLPNKNLQELEKIIKETIKNRNSQRANDEKVQKILEFLDKESKFELPEELVKQETERVKGLIIKENQSKGVSKDILEKKGKEIDEIAKREANKNLKMEFLLQEIASQEKIQTSNAEVEQYIKTMALTRKTNEKKLFQEMKKNQQLENIRHSIQRSKIIDFLLNNAILSKNSS